MMNANRATALPWNIYGDQRDSLALLDHGWIQVYAEDNQEALDLALMAYAVAEDARVRTPVMVNLDGFALTHTYETVDVPAPEQADAFLPPYDGSGNRFDFEHPVNIGFSAGRSTTGISSIGSIATCWRARRARSRRRRRVSPRCSDVAILA